MAVIDKIANKRIVKTGSSHMDYETWYDYMGVSIRYEEGLDDLFKKPMVTLVCPDKRKMPITITKKIGGTNFFHVVTDKGGVPKELQGSYTELGDAVLSVFKYFASMPTSARVKVEENLARKEAAKEQS